MSGWIKLHRQVSNNSLWTSEPFTRGQAWIDLLMIANFKDSYYFKRGVRVDVKRGEIGRSTVELADRWKWSRGKVNRFLSLLEKEEQIVQQKMNVTTLISIVNYDTYQQDDTASATPNVQQTSSKRTHIKNDKKEKKDNTHIDKPINDKNRDRYRKFIAKYNEITGDNKRGSDNDLNNFVFWLKSYTPEEIIQAVKNHDSTFWADKINPQWLFRTKDTKGQPVDYIGQLLDHKPKPKMI